jgi:hypothetical protein
MCPHNHKINKGDEKYGTPITRRYPWDRSFFLNPIHFKTPPPSSSPADGTGGTGFDKLKTSILTKNEKKQHKREEFDYVTRLVSNFFSSDSARAKHHAQWMQVEKVVALKNDYLETKFQQKFEECHKSMDTITLTTTPTVGGDDTTNGSGAPPAGGGCGGVGDGGSQDLSESGSWNDHQSLILRTFHSYTGRMSGLFYTSSKHLPCRFQHLPRSTFCPWRYMVSCGASSPCFLAIPLPDTWQILSLSQFASLSSPIRALSPGSPFTSNFFAF